MLLPAAQFDYRKGLGCTDALLTISHHLQKSFDTGMESYTGCSEKMYQIFVLFISPVKIEIFQVCLFHIIGNFVFHTTFFFLNIY